MPAAAQSPEEPELRLRPADRSRSVMLLGLMSGMATCALLFALLIRTTLPPFSLIATSAILVPCVSGFVAGVVGRRLASSLGVLLLGLFGIANIAGSPLIYIVLAIVICAGAAVGCAQLGIMATRRSPWALVFPVGLAAFLAWQVGIVRLDQSRMAAFQQRGLPAILAQVNRDVMDLPGSLQWEFRSDNDLHESSFIAESSRPGARYRVWVRRRSLKLRRFEVDIPPVAAGGIGGGLATLSHPRHARAYLLSLGFHSAVADGLVPAKPGFFIYDQVGEHLCRGQLDPDGAVSLTWGAERLRAR